MTRETRCCSFFRFALVADHGTLALTVSVPDEHIAVLDALTERAMAGQQAEPIPG